MGNTPYSMSTSTQTHARSPPISKLNNDILWYIFSLNADMEQRSEKTISALVTLRYTSQVCSDWRELALGSPLLWGRVINFQALSQREGQWRKEVLRRTGTAPLHIILLYDDFGWTPVLGFVEWLLGDHWARIQTLDLEFTSFSLDHTPWPSLLGRPAPSLQVFRASWSAFGGYLAAPDCVLFSNDAPSLRTLHVTNIGQNLTIVAIPNLRHLILHTSTTRSSALDLLGAFSRMPLLETLEVSTEFAPVLPSQQVDPPSSLPQVTLSRLMNVKLFLVEEVDISLPLLLCLIPAKGCALDLFSCYVIRSPGDESVNLQRTVLSTYSRNCPELASATNLHISLARNQCSFSVNLVPKRHFRFGIQGRSDDLPEHIISTFLPSLTTLKLNKITKLRLCLSSTEPQLPYLTIAKFMASLVSVETLITDPLTLGVLHVVQSHSTATIIPSLRIIHLPGMYDRVEPPIRKFLTTRIAMGISVDVLTMTIGPRLAIDIGPMLKFHGLTVQVTPDSETCQCEDC